ncbi:MAG: hybrid sensor histidine kinase/response regulator [Fimbriiglobus sp.]
MNAPMRDLYEREILTHTQTIDTALKSGQSGAMESLERATSQLKGASRILEFNPAAEVAKALEVIFSAVRRGVESLDRNRTLAILEATEFFRKTASAANAETDLPDAGPILTSLHVKATPVVEEVPEPIVVAPSSPPAPTVSMPMTRAEQNASLLEMFREEVKQLCDTLAEGLVTLEQDATDPRLIEPLMRAAHSIKGAARIVGVDRGVDLAHVMEDLLVAAQKGTTKLTSSDIDALLMNVDILAELASADFAQWKSTHANTITQNILALEERLAGKPLSPAAAPVRSTPPPSTLPPVVAEVVVPTAVIATPAPPPPPAPANEPEAKDRVIRVSAQSLTRLLSLAGESLVEARWLQPFARSLLRLKKFQDHLADILDEKETHPDIRRRLTDCRRILGERIDEFEQHASRSDDLNSRLYREVIASRMRPFSDGTQGYARMVRDLSRQLGKQVRLEILGQDTDVDRDILDKLDAPLGHMIRNAIDHGLETPDVRRAAGKPETGTLKVEARHQAGMLNIRVTDDGRGIDLVRLRKKVVERKLTTADIASRLSDSELLDFLFLPGFSTAEKVTDVSGRGVGLDAVQATAQAVGGLTRIHSKFGEGTTFELQLPITLSVMRAVLVRIGQDPFAWPLNRTDRLLKLATNAIQTLEGKPHFECDGRHIGLVPGRLIFGAEPDSALPDEICVVLIGDRSSQYGLIVDQFLGEQDLVVRPLDPRLGKISNISAAAVLDDGDPVLIVDVDDVIRSAGILVQEGKLRRTRVERSSGARRKRVLVVDDSAIVREAERQLLLGRGYEVELAIDGVDGWNAVRQGDFDLVVSDVDMPRMTGLEFVRAIRSDPMMQSLPVVIVSYKDRSEDRQRGLEVGASAYLTKSSFHDGKFLDTIEELIGPPLPTLIPSNG